MKKFGFSGLALTLVCAILLTGSGCTTSPANATPTPPATEVPYKSLVENFVKDDATYKFDGIDGSLKFAKTTGSAGGNSPTTVKDWEFVVGYQTGHPGHGNRIGQVLAQVITDHSAIIKVNNGKIASAICDGSWDMLQDKPISSILTEDDARKIAEQFIKNSSTYKFDGIEGSIKYVKTEPGWTSSFRSTAFTYDYKTRQPGHGDRSGKVLAQVITDHTAVILVNIEKGTVAMAVCDKTWDMVNDKNPPASVVGTVISGGDTTQPGSLPDVQRVFAYQVRKSDGTTVYVSYTAYPPSPVGDAARAKITLDFKGGSINIGDTMEALGRLDKETNTIVVADQGDYIRTYPAEPPAGPTKSTATPVVKMISEEAGWMMGDTIVAATITRPDDSAKHPGIVFVAGSGPTDRDWNSPLLPGTNGSARLLAEELAKQGYITIRYDKRVAGPNAAKNIPLMEGKISIESHIDELAGAVKLLLTRPDVNPDKVYVFGNSEGTIHALNYQLTREPKFAGLILQGAPGRNLADVMHTQIAAQVASLPNAAEIMAGYDKLIANFLAGKPFEPDPTIPEGLNNLVKGFYAPINLPFTREFLTVDATQLLGKVTAPVLVMIGKKDVQVDAELDGKPLENAAQGHNNVTFVYPENANHVLKLESRPRSALTGADAVTYNASDKVLDPEAVKIVKEWLASH